MRTHPRQMEERLAWRSLVLVALPALLLPPLLATQRGEHGAPAGEPAPLFTMAAEPPPRAQAEPLQPCPPETAPPIPHIDYMVQSTVAEPALVEPVAFSFDACRDDDSDLTVTSLPEPRQPRPATNQNCKLSIARHAEALAKADKSTSPPAYLSAPKPPYPAVMRQRRLQGCVGVRIAVSPLGTPTAVDITQPSGHAEFDSATRSWILRHWRFRPATAAGRAVASTVTTTVRFTLN